MFEVKKYQRRAIEELKEEISLKLGRKNKPIISFKAPTGSGKTFIMSKVIEELTESNNNDSFAFIWASFGSGDLHIQSYMSLKKYFNGYPKVLLLDENLFSLHKNLNDKEVLVLNWEKLNRKENGNWMSKAMRNQENTNFIDFINNTKQKGIKIILIIDESHYGYDIRTQINELKTSIIDPDLIIEMSATPITDNPSVEIDYFEVIEEGMIKKSLIVNDGITERLNLIENITSEILLMDLGLQKRKEILQRYKDLKVNVNPLVLIQIPNGKKGDDKIAFIEDYLKNKNVTRENGKLKVWISEDKTFNKEQIKQNLDETEFLIFKVAVATGWDCPRAHILIKFRDTSSEQFEIQTIGRILRTPEAKHYDCSILDNAYMYTNASSFLIKEKDVRDSNIIKTNITYKRESIDDTSIKLYSYYKNSRDNINWIPLDDTTILARNFNEYFNIEELDSRDSIIYKLEQKNFMFSNEVEDSILSQKNIESIKIGQNELNIVSEDKLKIGLSQNEIYHKFQDIIRKNLNGLDFSKSYISITSTLYDVLSKLFDDNQKKNKIEILQNIIVNNEHIFSEIINKSTFEYKEKLEILNKNKGEYYKFIIPNNYVYSTENFEVLNGLELSYYNPLVLRKNIGTNNVNNLEKSFIYFLESNSDYIEWYWVNGTENTKFNFGIPYNKNKNIFRPDFIVKYKNNSIGIYDTKAIQDRIYDTKNKAEALQDYLYKMNDAGIKVHGGIIVSSKVDKNGLYSDFYINDKKIYSDFNTDRKSWKSFNQYIKTMV